MSTKTILKIMGGVLVVALLIFSVVYQNELRAILHLPEKYVSIKNQDSQLLEILPMPDDFSNEFIWNGVWITQGNSEYGESARSVLGGFYQWFSFLAVTEIKQFVEKANLTQSAVEADFAFPVNGELSGLNLDKIFATQKSNCYYWIDDSSECDVVIVYNDKVIGLQVMLESGADKSLLEQITNSLLLAIQEDFE
jgi:hypothetical protein